MDTAEIINNMIDKIIQGDNTNAQEDFEALISSKLQTAIDDKKVEVAQSIYGTSDASIEDEEEVEITDDEFEETEEDTEEAS